MLSEDDWRWAAAARAETGVPLLVDRVLEGVLLRPAATALVDGVEVRGVLRAVALSTEGLLSGRRPIPAEGGFFVAADILETRRMPKRTCVCERFMRVVMGESNNCFGGLVWRPVSWPVDANLKVNVYIYGGQRTAALLAGGRGWCKSERREGEKKTLMFGCYVNVEECWNGQANVLLCYLLVLLGP